jgi:hypothetical protein
MCRQQQRLFLVVLTVFVVASSATKGTRRLGVRRSLQNETLVEQPPVPEPPIKDPNKEEKEKKEKKDKEKKCKLKENKTKAPSAVIPPPPPAATPAVVGQGSVDNSDTIVTTSNLVGGTTNTTDSYSWNRTIDENGVDDSEDTTNSTTNDITIVEGNPLVSSAEEGNATLVEEDLPFCTDEEDPDRLATDGANIGKAPIAASALGLVTIILGFIGYKYYRDRKSRESNDKVCVPNLY